MNIQGLVAAPSTPMNKDWSINFRMIPEYAQCLKENGVSGVFVNGTTGESSSLTIKERIQLAEAWVAHKDDNFKVIIHIGDNAVDNVRYLCNHANEIDADATGAVTPFYYGASLENIVEFFAMGINDCPDLPFYYYHIPCLSRADFKVIDFLKAADEKIPSLTGVKFTHEDFMDYHQCVLYKNGKFDMLFGRDESYLGGLAHGAKGAVGSTYNYAPGLYYKIKECFDKGDIKSAGLYQQKSIEIVNLLGKYGGIECGKAITKLAGLDCGQCRYPLKQFSDEMYDSLKQDLENIGFFEFCI